MMTKTTVGAGVLTVAALAGGAGAAVAAPAHGMPGTPNESCHRWATTHTFVSITKAKGNPKAGLTVSGLKVTVHCGGPDDMQYILTNKPFTGHLLPSAKIKILTFTNGIQFPALAQAQFPRWVAHDHNSGIYTVAGPFSAIREIDEQYHP